MHSRRLGLALFLVSLMVLPAGGVAYADQEVRITLSDFSFQPADITVRAGEPVRFVATNVGQQEHEFRTEPEGIRVEIIPGGADVQPGETATSQAYTFTQP